jgi:3-hydroxybutyryl-CoA dehydrogenase
MTGIDKLGIVGAGAMGRGIAQIAAQAAIDVWIYDTNAQALTAAQTALAQTCEMLLARGKLTAGDVQAILGRIHVTTTLNDFADCQWVIEAIVENLDIKRSLFVELEAVVGEQCILASNTSSLSITAIAAACSIPKRVAGFHFFNPVPLMKVVEVIDGLRSAPETGDQLMALAKRLGHTPVRAKDMPGFVVNHAGRGMNIEGLKVAQEAVAPFHEIDAIMRETAGFRMGPFELLDLTALDVSHPVMETIYRQFFDEPRFRPSPITAVRLAGGLLGKKVGEGFYTYKEGKKEVPAERPTPPRASAHAVWVSSADKASHEQVVACLRAMGVTASSDRTPPADALIIVTPYGTDVSTAVYEQALDGARTVGVDTLFGLAQGKRRTLMTSPATQSKWRDAAHALFAADGTAVSVINDSPGFVAQRIVAAIVNVACDIAQQKIASPQDIDRAVTLGLGYPSGPLALGDTLGVSRMFEILSNLLAVTGDARYRPSLWLRRRVQLKLSLLDPG